MLHPKQRVEGVKEAQNLMLVVHKPILTVKSRMVWRMSENTLNLAMCIHGSLPFPTPPESTSGPLPQMAHCHLSLPPMPKVSRTNIAPLTRAENSRDYCRLYRKQPKGGPDFSVEGGKAGLKANTQRRKTSCAEAAQACHSA